MVSVELQNIRMHGFHGVFEGEKKTGSLYEINIKVNYEEGKADFNDLKQTINYSELFGIIKKRMQIPTPLLEKVAERIIGRIKHEYPNATEVILSIFKLQAPIEGIEGKVGVTMHKRYNG